MADEAFARGTKPRGAVAAGNRGRGPAGAPVGRGGAGTSGLRPGATPCYRCFVFGTSPGQTRTAVRATETMTDGRVAQLVRARP